MAARTSGSLFKGTLTTERIERPGHGAGAVKA
jgi:hypothetical protein